MVIGLTHICPHKSSAPFPDAWTARQGLKPGDVSQTGQIFTLLLESMAKCNGYDEVNYPEGYASRYSQFIQFLGELA